MLRVGGTERLEQSPAAYEGYLLINRISGTTKQPLSFSLLDSLPSPSSLYPLLSNHNSIRQPAELCDQEDRIHSQAHSCSRSLRELNARLSLEREDSIFVVRKIHRFWDEATVYLTKHFSLFGQVREVMLLPWRKPRESGRLRPSSLGFILMDSADSVASILQVQVHVIEGLSIPVEPYKSVSDCC